MTVLPRTGIKPSVVSSVVDVVSVVMNADQVPSWLSECAYAPPLATWLEMIVRFKREHDAGKALFKLGPADLRVPISWIVQKDFRVAETFDDEEVI